MSISPMWEGGDEANRTPASLPVGSVDAADRLSAPYTYPPAKAIGRRAKSPMSGNRGWWS
ncbi:MAG TPA: hypothetical protein VHM21_04800 [Sphingomicrobium sp.]|nr:hypothetical protein [Sphingomicrobium sp.]